MNIAGFVYNVGRVGWLGFWRRKPATRPAGVKSGRGNPSPTVGVVGSGGYQFGFERVGRVGLDTPRSATLTSVKSFVNFLSINLLKIK